MRPLRLAVSGRLNRLAPAALARLTNRQMAPDEGVRFTVSEIIERVREGGDAALRELAATLDGVNLSDLEVPREAWRTALGALGAETRAAMTRAADNIACVHKAFLPQRAEVEVEPGVHVARRALPLERVGVYVPGGRAAYPSSLLMGVVPARVAGVREIIVCTPASATGWPSDAVMAAAELAGATRMFAVGGAGAIAAMALGTATIPRVDCVVGPGNAYVTEAKLQLMRSVRIDLPAGPSEVLVIADDSADLCAVAAELAAQAEHGSESAALAVLVGAGLSVRLEAAIASLLPELERADIVYAALASQGAILEADSVDEALAFADAYAPEHLVIATHDAALLAERPRNAGSIFVGCQSSVTFGDYITGANHVLPTAGYARTHSGLSIETFMRWTTVQTVEPQAARRLAPLVSALASVEQLGAHAAAAARAGAAS